MTEEKIRENRLRRMAHRQGLKLSRSRTRDERAIDFDRYLLADLYTSAVVFGVWSTGRHEATLDEIEGYLSGNKSIKKKPANRRAVTRRKA